MKKAKKIISIILSILVLSGTMFTVSFSANAKTEAYYYDFFEDDHCVIRDLIRYGYYLFWINDDGEVVVCDYLGSDKKIQIPNKLDGKTVTCLGGFGGLSVEEIIVPDTITTVYNNSLTYNLNLKKITFPESVKSIGFNVLKSCSSLVDITLGKNVEFIDYGFAYDTPYVSDEKNYKNGCLYIGSNLINGKKCRSSNLVIEKGTTVIANGAFSDVLYENQIITCVTLPKSLKIIGSNAFGDCRKIKEVTIPNSVKKICAQAFAGCTSLKKLTIGSGVTEIGESAFVDCPLLSNITIPGNVKKIGNKAFGFCTVSNGDSANSGTETSKYITNINGYANSAAEKYAKKNGFNFTPFTPKTGTIMLSAGKGKITAKASAVTGADGFQIKYTIGKKTVTKNFTCTGAATKQIKSLKAGKYTVTARRYAKYGSKTVYSTWTKSVKLTVK